MSDILDTIDGALDDYMSPDAMRWSPEPEEVEREWTRGFGGWRYGGYVDAEDVGLLGGTRGNEICGYTPRLAILDEVRLFAQVNVQPFADAMNRVTAYLAELAGIPTWLTTPPPPELTNETLRLLAEAPRDAAIATNVETSCSDKPVPIVVQAPEVTLPKSPKVRAAIERWGDEGRRR